RSAWAAKDDRQGELSIRHVAQLGGVVDELIVGSEGEVPGHELDDRPQPDHRGADADAGEAGLRDRRVDHPALAEPLQHALGSPVGAVIVADLLTHQEDGVVALHLLAHGLAERFAERDDATRLRHRRARGPSPARAAAIPRRTPRRPPRRPWPRRRAASGAPGWRCRASACDAPGY